jgi:hypothetical protein
VSIQFPIGSNGLFTSFCVIQEKEVISPNIIINRVRIGLNYLYVIKYTETQWKEHCNQREGLPWFKSSSGKTSGARV